MLEALLVELLEELLVELPEEPSVVVDVLDVVLSAAASVAVPSESEELEPPQAVRAKGETASARARPTVTMRFLLSIVIPFSQGI